MSTQIGIRTSNRPLPGISFLPNPWYIQNMAQCLLTLRRERSPALHTDRFALNALCTTPYEVCRHGGSFHLWELQCLALTKDETPVATRGVGHSRHPPLPYQHSQVSPKLTHLIQLSVSSSGSRDTVRGKKRTSFSMTMDDVRVSSTSIRLAITSATCPEPSTTTQGILLLMDVLMAWERQDRAHQMEETHAGDHQSPAWYPGSKWGGSSNTLTHPCIWVFIFNQKQTKCVPTLYEWEM